MTSNLIPPFTITSEAANGPVVITNSDSSPFSLSLSEGSYSLLFSLIANFLTGAAAQLDFSISFSGTLTSSDVVFIASGGGSISSNAGESAPARDIANITMSTMSNSQSGNATIAGSGSLVVASAGVLTISVANYNGLNGDTATITQGTMQAS